MILGGQRRIELAMCALPESVLIMSMSVLLLLLGNLVLVVWGVRLSVIALPLSAWARIVCVLCRARCRGRRWAAAIWMSSKLCDGMFRLTGCGGVWDGR